MPLGKQDRGNRRVEMRLARGGTAAGDAAVRKARKKAWEKSLEPFQKELNEAHAKWVADGMPMSVAHSK